MCVTQRRYIVERFVATAHEYLLDVLGLSKALHHFKRVSHGTVDLGNPHSNLAGGGYWPV